MNLGRIGGVEIEKVLWDEFNHSVVLLVRNPNPYRVSKSEGWAENIFTYERRNYEPPKKSLEDRMIDAFKKWENRLSTDEELSFVSSVHNKTPDSDEFVIVAFHAGFMAGKGDKE